MSTYDERIEQLRNNAKDRAYDTLHNMSLYETLLGPSMQRLDEDGLKRMPTPDCVYFDEHPYKGWNVTSDPLPTCQVEVYAPVDVSIPWRKRMAPMAAFFAAFGIKTRERHVSQYSGAVSYTGKVVRNGWEITITYNTGQGGLSPSCKLVAEETEETVKRVHYTTVCD